MTALLHKSNEGFISCIQHGSRSVVYKKTDTSELQDHGLASL